MKTKFGKVEVGAITPEEEKLMVFYGKKKPEKKPLKLTIKNYTSYSLDLDIHTGFNSIRIELLNIRGGVSERNRR